jgi:polyhydroxyalkanoate synthesis regulator phasin
VSENDEKRTARERVSEGFNKGLGVLAAFKEALDETIAEARERGDLSSDRAKDALKGAMNRAREATSDARERFDFVSQQEFDGLSKRVSDLESRVREHFGGQATGVSEDEDEAEPRAGEAPTS